MKQLANDQLHEEKNRAEEEIQALQHKLDKMGLDLQRAIEETECRKMINDQMVSQLFEHEKEQADMAEKMTFMKNAMMQHDMGVGMARTYGCVKLQTLKNIPVTI